MLKATHVGFSSPPLFTCQEFFFAVLMVTISLPGLSSGDVGALGEAGCGQRLGGGEWGGWVLLWLPSLTTLFPLQGAAH